MSIRALGMGIDILIEAAGGLPAIADALSKLIPTHRQCLIKIQNFSSKHTLRNPQMFVFSGHSGHAMAPVVRAGFETSLFFVKNSDTACGAVAVVTYDIDDPITTNKRLAIMFSVPYDFNLYSNWFSVGFYYQYKHCDYGLYKDMYYNDFGAPGSDFARQRGGEPLSFEKWLFRVEATMSDTYTPNILIKFYDHNPYNENQDDASGSITQPI